MKTITLEEHFVTKDFLKAIEGKAPAFPEKLQEQLLDIGDARIASMDANGIDLQVLSIAAIGVDALDKDDQTAMMRSVNDEAAAAVKAHPERFAAFATPGLKDPTAAVKELERCVRELGFKGLMVNGTSEGSFLDEPQFMPLFEAAVDLDVPVYLHPAPPPKAVKEAYFYGLPEEIVRVLSTAGWGWHAEMGLHLLRLIVSGVFDRLPKLQMIVGHMGEGLPYALARTNGIVTPVCKNLKRSITETLRDQVYVTTSGYFSHPPFHCCKEVLGLDRMMYSVDYPFSGNEKGKEFLSGLGLSETELGMLKGGLTEKVLRL
jgi:predicted TIM-barrel fold metal-dependent hydrolase